MQNSRHHKNIKSPGFLLLNYQTNGSTPGQEVTLPDYSEMTMWSGMDWLHKRFNSIYSPNEVQFARIGFDKDINDIIVLLNQISLEWLAQVQDAPILW